MHGMHGKTGMLFGLRRSAKKLEPRLPETVWKRLQHKIGTFMFKNQNDGATLKGTNHRYSGLKDEWTNTSTTTLAKKIVTAEKFRRLILQFDHVISCDIKLRFDIDATHGVCAPRVALQIELIENIEVAVAWYHMIALQINLMNNSAVAIFLARVVLLGIVMFIPSVGRVRRPCRGLQKLCQLVLQRCYGYRSAKQETVHTGRGVLSFHFFFFWRERGTVWGPVVQWLVQRFRSERLRVRSRRWRLSHRRPL